MRWASARRAAAGAAAALLAGAAVQANNLQITNTVVTAPTTPGGAAKVTFDISWENSWRATNVTDDAYWHDAAWVFFKVTSTGVDTWKHVKLSGSGTNPAGFSRGSAGANIELIVPADGVGLFIRRSVDNLGHGSLSSTGVEVLWDPADSGISPSSQVRVRAMGIEMVYVAQGSFWAGDGFSNGSFTPTQIITADPTAVGGRPTGETAPAATWPNGYNAFYLMKYICTQQQYLDFVSCLTQAQAIRHGAPTWTIAGGYFSRSGTWPSFTCAHPNRPLCQVHWIHTAAYLDWAGLRPYTELEYEKACRGPEAYVAGEYAWGTTSYTDVTTLSGTAGSGTETPTLVNANVSLVSVFPRVGIFATASSGREKAGAGYWGNLDLSGGVYERTIGLHHANGRAFTGLHGDGELTAYGYANVADGISWYTYDYTQVAGAYGPLGIRHKGAGGASGSAIRARTSDRAYVSGSYAMSIVDGGIRGARTAP